MIVTRAQAEKSIGSTSKKGNNIRASEIDEQCEGESELEEISKVPVDGINTNMVNEERSGENIDPNWSGANCQSGQSSHSSGTSVTTGTGEIMIHKKDGVKVKPLTTM